uniref:Uncharacterized protein n=1 Tax=Romanomermis culicivorax TaxID=13658 RepID=A0A915KE72_ROMCU
MADDSSEDSDVEEFTFHDLLDEQWRDVFRYLPIERQNRLLQLQRERMRERARLQVLHSRAFRLRHYQLSHPPGHLCDFCQTRDHFLHNNPQHRFVPYSLKQIILLRYGYKLFYDKISSNVKYSLLNVVTSRRLDQPNCNSAGDRQYTINYPGIPWQVDGSLHIRSNEQLRAHRNALGNFLQSTNGRGLRVLPPVQYDDQFWSPLGSLAEDLREMPRSSLIFRPLQRADAQSNDPYVRTNNPPENLAHVNNSGDSNQQSTQPEESAARLTDNEIDNFLSDEYFTLSNDLLRMLKQIVRELSDFCQYMSNLIDIKLLCDDLRRNWFRCFLNYLHWLPDNRRMTIDRKVTSLMILRTFEEFYTLHELSSSTGIEFILAAENMLEEEARRIYPRLDSAVLHIFDLMQYEGHSIEAVPSSRSELNFSPLVYYWAAVCSNIQHRIQASIRGINNSMELLRHFFPLIRDVKNFARHRDHFFHLAVQAGNIPAVRYLLTGIVENDSTVARQMINATSCCGSRNSFYALNACLAQEKDINSDEIEADDQPCTSRQTEERLTRRADASCELFAYLWSFLTDEERNNATLAEHASLFVRSVSLGLFPIARTIWNSAGKNQRFVIMFQGGCEAFRNACAKGYADIVSMIWSSLNEDEKKQILTVYQNDAFISAVANNHLHIVNYLLNNVKSSIRTWLVETAAKRSIEACILYNCPVILYVLKHEMPKREYLHVVLSDNKAILNAILKKGGVEIDEKFSEDVKMKPPDRPDGQKDGEQYWRSEAVWLLQECRVYDESKSLDLARTKQAAANCERERKNSKSDYEHEQDATDGEQEEDDESSSVEDFADEYCTYDDG